MYFLNLIFSFNILKKTKFMKAKHRSLRKTNISAKPFLSVYSGPRWVRFINKCQKSRDTATLRNGLKLMCRDDMRELLTLKLLCRDNTGELLLLTGIFLKLYRRTDAANRNISLNILQMFSVQSIIIMKGDGLSLH